MTDISVDILFHSTDSLTEEEDARALEEQLQLQQEQENRIKHHTETTEVLPAVYIDDQTFSEDDKLLLDYALEHRSTESAPNVNVQQRQSVFCEGLKLARMKTIMNLMTRLNVIEEHMLDPDALKSADLKELAHVHRQLKDALALHLDAVEGKSSAPTAIFNANIQNNDNSHTEVTTTLQAVIEDPQKRRRVMSTFAELLKTASHG